MALHLRSLSVSLKERCTLSLLPLDRWADALSLRFLEAGAGSARHDGWAHAKTVPFGILTQATLGSYELKVGGRTVDGPMGTAIFAPPHEPLIFVHRFDRSAGSMRFRFAHFGFVLWGGLDVLSLLAPPERLTGAAAVEAGACIEGLLAQRGADGLPLHALARRQELGFGLLRLLSAQAVLRPGAHEVLAGAARLAPLLRTLRDRLAEPLDIPALAKLAHLSRASLHRQFLSVLGVPPMEYLKRLRLDEAARRLLRADESLAGVAAQVGFANPYHFSREFKARYGMPPAQYRADRLFRPGSLGSRFG